MLKELLKYHGKNMFSLIKAVATITFYPRKVIDGLLFRLFVNNDYDRLNVLRGEDTLIVGNGPSLNYTDLARLKMPSVGMNKINLIFSKTKWRPDVIVCVNGLVIHQNKDFFNTTNITLVVPVKAMYLGIRRRPNIIFVKILDRMSFRDSIKEGFGAGSTVTYSCLQLAASVKVKSVNIVGVDHSFGNTNNKDAHKIERLNGEDMSHFHPDYFKNQFWGLPDLVGSEQAFALARKYFETRKIPIVDYTIEGKLMVFEKGEIKELYK